MSTQIDWRGELDRAIEHGTDRPPGEYVVSGRRAVRRRRTVASVAGLAVAVALGGVTWAALPGSGPGGAESHVASGGASPSASDGADAPPWDAEAPPARVLRGELELRPGSVVHERRDDIWPDAATGSAALDVTYAGTRWWVVLEWDEGGGNRESVQAEDAEGTFDDFVAEAVAGGPGVLGVPDSGDDELMFGGLLDYSTQGLVLGDGVTLVRQVENPHGVAAPKTSIGAVLERDGTTHWVSAIAYEHGAGATHTEAGRSGWLTFDQWLADDVALQAGKPGLELVAFGPDGTLVPGTPGVEILDQQADPYVPEYAGRSAEGSAVAKLTWEDHTWFVLRVRSGREVTHTVVAASKADGADTLEEFIAVLRDHADEGGFE